MNEQERKEHREIGWMFGIMSVLAFIYIGALSAALEGWTLAFTILSWAGMTILIGSAIALMIPLIAQVRADCSDTP